MKPKKRTARKEPDRDRLEREFKAFAAAKGWDEDRRLQVLAELSFPEPQSEMLDALVDAGATDVVVEQLHQYHDKEEDYFSRLLKKLLQVKPTGAVNAGLVEKVVAKLNEIKAG